MSGIHTRRTPPSMTPPPQTQSSTAPMPSSLTKSATFNAPLTPPAELSHPLVVTPALPRRAQTCAKALEEVVASREQRMAALISSLDHNLPGVGRSRRRSTASSYGAEELPLPQAVLDTASDLDRADPSSDSKKTSRRRQPQLTRHDHNYDSGLGSSVSGSSITSSHREKVLASFTAINRSRTRSGRRADSMTSQISSSSRGLSAITRSHSALASSGTDAQHDSLSVHATAQIQKLILSPILRRPFLRDFHPLLRDVPRRIHTKDILCLRDLEKTLLLLAPERAKSPELYLNFCETSIHCIQATVDTLHDRDQRRPSDRPYTTGYFLDLVEQVRHYADIMAASREQEAAGKVVDESEYSSNEHVALHGGLSQTGQPAQLVRVKNGKKISIATGDEVSDVETSTRSLKRASSHGLSDDDSVHRSMARRAGKRKLTSEAATAMAQQQCGECGKDFKRPCDLTKHEKTHSRPWKCTEKGCKYYTLGWPTEKERDRHVNDKHSDSPPMYHCEYPPCAYKSKRESNCKQHMEKSHGWTYVRSKNNGKAVRNLSTTTRTPQTPNLGTPSSSSVDTPQSSYDMASPSHDDPPSSGQALDENEDDILNDPLADFPLRPTSFSLDDYPVDALPMDEGEYGFEEASYSRESMAMVQSAHLTSSGTHADYQPSPQFPTSHLAYDDHHWSAEPPYPNDMASFQMHMPTPAQLMTPMDSVKGHTFNSFDSSRSALSHADASPTAYFSPGTHGQVMLYTPPADGENVDEGFEEFTPPTGRHTMDFNLFSSEASSSIVSNPTDGMFQDLPPFDGSHPAAPLSQGFPDYMDWDHEHGQ